MEWLKEIWITPLTVGGWIVLILVSDYLIKPLWQAFINWIILNWLGIK